MDDSCILVFTSRSIDRMRREGGSQAWVLDAKRARRCRYLVAAWNSTGDYAEGGWDLNAHGQAFMLAPISSIEPAPEEPRRHIIRFIEFARVEIPEVWNHQRNPVYYTTLHDLGIGLKHLEFEAAKMDDSAAVEVGGWTAVQPLTFADARQGLALKYDLHPSAIEIVIRG